MTKAEALERWKAITPNQNILKHFKPVPKEATGSRYGACGIRIDGSPEFIDAVLSRLQDLIAGENQITRLGLARNEVGTVEVAGKVKSFANACDSKGKPAECCYIRLHKRGPEAIAYAGILNPHLADATEQFADALE